MLPTPKKKLSALVHPCSEITEHVRELNIKTTCQGSNSLTHEADEALRVFLAAVPFRRLHSLRNDVGISMSTMYLLLQCHRSLQSLNVMNATDLAQPDYFDAVVPLLGSIDKLSIHLSGYRKALSDKQL